MKRYGIFAYGCYYPYGGMGDFWSDHDTIEEAKAALWDKKDGYNSAAEQDVCQIYDFETKEIIWEKP